MGMFQVAVIGASGYTGAELMRFLLRHPQVQLTCIAGDSTAGKDISLVYPHLHEICEMKVEDTEPAEISKKANFVFVALPSGHAAEIVPKLVQSGVRVIDLGGDLRLSSELYKTWYKKTPPPADLQEQAVYGLAEWYSDEIRGAELVSNPGCYPTATLMALLPFVKAGAVELDSIIVDAKSGVSGAGRSLALGSLFSEVNENFKAYKVNQHQHTPEIELQMSRVAGKPVAVTFTPHLVPMTRGILATCYAKVQAGWTEAQLQELLQTTYEGKPFVRVRPLGNYPQTKEVSQSNYCDIGLSYDERTGRVTVLAAIDNLVKGASGQAIQNFNVMAGLPETTGLLAVPSYP